MIKVNIIPPPTVPVMDPEGRFLGSLNEYEFLDLRVQIKEHGIKGYWYSYKGVRYNIREDGMINDSPDGMFSMIGDYYAKLIS